MPKVFAPSRTRSLAKRLIALLLVPCLVADPVSATAFSSTSLAPAWERGRVRGIDQAPFQEQALAEQIISASHYVLDKFPRIRKFLSARILAGKSAPPAAPENSASADAEPPAPFAQSYDINIAAVGPQAPTHKNVNEAVGKFREAGRVKKLGSVEMRGVLSHIGKFYPYLAERIKHDGYQVYLYGGDQTKELIPGQTTHAGIRARSIHIAKGEYQRLMQMDWKGLRYLAGRIAHEAREISRWRDFAVSKGLSPDDGSMRKWIKDNLQEANNYHLIFHNEGVQFERTVAEDPRVGSEQILDDSNDINSAANSGDKSSPPAAAPVRKHEQKGVVTYGGVRSGTNTRRDVEHPLMLAAVNTGTPEQGEIVRRHLNQLATEIPPAHVKELRTIRASFTARDEVRLFRFGGIAEPKDHPEVIQITWPMVSPYSRARQKRVLNVLAHELGHFPEGDPDINAIWQAARPYPEKWMTFALFSHLVGGWFLFLVLAAFGLYQWDALRLFLTGHLWIMVPWVLLGALYTPWMVWWSMYGTFNAMAYIALKLGAPFVSAYSMSNAGEDFAETYRFYVLHRATFESRSQRNAGLRRKYEAMKKIFGHAQAAPAPPAAAAAPAKPKDEGEANGMRVDSLFGRMYQNLGATPWRSDFKPLQWVRSLIKNELAPPHETWGYLRPFLQAWVKLLMPLRLFESPMAPAHSVMLGMTLAGSDQGVLEHQIGSQGLERFADDLLGLAAGLPHRIMAAHKLAFFGDQTVPVALEGEARARFEAKMRGWIQPILAAVEDLLEEDLAMTSLLLFPWTLFMAGVTSWRIHRAYNRSVTDQDAVGMVPGPEGTTPSGSLPAPAAAPQTPAATVPALAEAAPSNQLAVGPLMIEIRNQILSSAESEAYAFITTVDWLMVPKEADGFGPYAKGIFPHDTVREPEKWAPVGYVHWAEHEGLASRTYFLCLAIQARNTSKRLGYHPIDIKSLREGVAKVLDYSDVLGFRHLVLPGKPWPTDPSDEDYANAVLRGIVDHVARGPTRLRTVSIAVNDPDEYQCFLRLLAQLRADPNLLMNPPEKAGEDLPVIADRFPPSALSHALQTIRTLPLPWKVRSPIVIGYADTNLKLTGYAVRTSENEIASKITAVLPYGKGGENYVSFEWNGEEMWFRPSTGAEFKIPAKYIVFDWDAPRRRLTIGVTAEAFNRMKGRFGRRDLPISAKVKDGGWVFKKVEVLDAGPSSQTPSPAPPRPAPPAGSRKLKGPEGGAIGVLWAPIARGLQEHLRWGLRGAGAVALIAAAIVEGGAIGSLAPYVSGGHPWIAAGIGVTLGYVAHALFGLLVPNAEGNWEAVGLAAGRSPPTGERLKFLLQVLPATLAFAASFLSFIPAYHQSSAWTTVAAAILPHLLANLVYITYVFRNLRSRPAAAPPQDLARSDAHEESVKISHLLLAVAMVALVGTAFVWLAGPWARSETIVASLRRNGQGLLPLFLGALTVTGLLTASMMAIGTLLGLHRAHRQLSHTPQSLSVGGCASAGSPLWEAWLGAGLFCLGSLFGFLGTWGTVRDDPRFVGWLILSAVPLLSGLGFLGSVSRILRQRMTRLGPPPTAHALVLDDRAKERLPATTYLKEQGYAVDEASYFSEAVGKVRLANAEGRPYTRVIADLDLGRKIYQKHHLRDGLWFVVWLKWTQPDVDATLHSTAFNGGHRRFFLVRALTRWLGVKVQGKEIINAALSGKHDKTYPPAADAVVISGPGLQKGVAVTYRIFPGARGSGIVFRRTDAASEDQPQGHDIPVRESNVTNADKIIILYDGTQGFAGPEHLLSALYAFGIDDARIEVDNFQTPVMSNNAKAYADAFAQTPWVTQTHEEPFVITQPLLIQDAEGRITHLLLPHDGLQVSYLLDYPVLGQKYESLEVAPQSYQELIAPARNFIFEKDHPTELIQEYLKDTEASVVIGPRGVLTPPDRLSVPEDPALSAARHKILDLLGDLRVADRRIRGRVFAFKTGHLENHRLLVQQLNQVIETGVYPTLTVEALGRLRQQLAADFHGERLPRDLEEILGLMNTHGVDTSAPAAAPDDRPKGSTPSGSTPGGVSGTLGLWQRLGIWQDWTTARPESLRSMSLTAIALTESILIFYGGLAWVLTSTIGIFALPDVLFPRISGHMFYVADFGIYGLLTFGALILGHYFSGIANPLGPQPTGTRSWRLAIRASLEASTALTGFVFAATRLIYEPLISPLIDTALGLLLSIGPHAWLARQRQKRLENLHLANRLQEIATAIGWRIEIKSWLPLLQDASLSRRREALTQIEKLLVDQLVKREPEDPFMDELQTTIRNHAMRTENQPLQAEFERVLAMLGPSPAASAPAAAPDPTRSTVKKNGFIFPGTLLVLSGMVAAATVWMFPWVLTYQVMIHQHFAATWGILQAYLSKLDAKNTLLLLSALIAPLAPLMVKGRKRKTLIADSGPAVRLIHHLTRRELEAIRFQTEIGSEIDLIIPGRPDLRVLNTATMAHVQSFLVEATKRDGKVSVTIDRELDQDITHPGAIQKIEIIIKGITSPLPSGLPRSSLNLHQVIDKLIEQSYPSHPLGILPADRLRLEIEGDSDLCVDTSWLRGQGDSLMELAVATLIQNALDASRGKVRLRLFKTLGGWISLAVTNQGAINWTALRQAALGCAEAGDLRRDIFGLYVVGSRKISLELGWRASKDEVNSLENEDLLSIAGLSTKPGGPIGARRTYGSKGLGLAVIYQTLSRLRGTVELEEDTTHHAVTFCISMPPAAAPGAHSEYKSGNPWKPIQHLIEPLPSIYQNAVLDEFVRSERYPDSIGYTAADNSPHAYQKLLWDVSRLVGDLRGRRMLEIGCGPGVIVETLRRLGGSDAIGVEADGRFVHFAEEHGVPIIQSTLETVSQKLAGRTFDVTFSHRFLDALAKVINRPDGTVQYERRLNHPEELRVLATIAALTPSGAWSIHATREPLPFTDAEFEQVGFKIIEVNAQRTFIALKKLPAAAPTPTATVAAADSPPTTMMQRLNKFMDSGYLKWLILGLAPFLCGFTYGSALRAAATIGIVAGTASLLYWILSLKQKPPAAATPKQVPNRSRASAVFLFLGGGLIALALACLAAPIFGWWAAGVGGMALSAALTWLVGRALDRHLGAVEPPAPAAAPRASQIDEAGVHSMQATGESPAERNAARRRAAVREYFNQYSALPGVTHEPQPEVLEHQQYFLDALQELDGPILDVGAGFGRDATALETRGRRVVSLDLAEQMLAEAHKRLPTRALVQGHAAKLPVRSGTLAGIWCNAMFQYLTTSEATDALEEFHRILKPGGLLFLRVNQVEGLGSDPDDRPHGAYAYKSDELIRLLQQHEFDVLASGIQPNTPPRSVAANPSKLFSWNVRYRGWQWLYGYARRNEATVKRSVSEEIVSIPRQPTAPAPTPTPTVAAADSPPTTMMQRLNKFMDSGYLKWLILGLAPFLCGFTYGSALRAAATIGIVAGTASLLYRILSLKQKPPAAAPTGAKKKGPPGSGEPPEEKRNVEEAQGEQSGQRERAGQTRLAGLTRRELLVLGGAAVVGGIAAYVAKKLRVETPIHTEQTGEELDQLANTVLDSSQSEADRRRAHVELSALFYDAILPDAVKAKVGSAPSWWTPKYWNDRTWGKSDFQHTVWKTARRRFSSDPRATILRHPKALTAFVVGLGPTYPEVPESVADVLLVTMLRTATSTEDYRNIQDDVDVARYLLGKSWEALTWPWDIKSALGDPALAEEVKMTIAVVRAWAFMVLFRHLNAEKLWKQFAGSGYVAGQLTRLIRYFVHKDPHIRDQFEQGTDRVARTWLESLRPSPQELESMEQWLVEHYAQRFGSQTAARAFVQTMGRVRPGVVSFADGILETIPVQSGETVRSFLLHSEALAASGEGATSRDFQVAVYLLALLVDRLVIPARQGETLLYQVLSDKNPASFIRTELVPVLREQMGRWQQNAPIPFIEGLRTDPDTSGRTGVARNWQEVNWKDLLVRALIGITFQDELYVPSTTEFVQVQEAIDLLGDRPVQDSDYLLALSYAIHASAFTQEVLKRLPRGLALRHGEWWREVATFDWPEVARPDMTKMRILGSVTALPNELSHAYSAVYGLLVARRGDHTGLAIFEYEDRVGSMALRKSRPWLTYPEGQEWITSVMELGQDYISLQTKDSQQDLLLVTDRNEAEQSPTPLERYHMGLLAREKRIPSPHQRSLDVMEATLKRGGVELASFRREIDQIGGIQTLAIEGFKGVRLPSRLPPYRDLDRWVFMTTGYHQMAERLSGELILQLIRRIAEANRKAVPNSSRIGANLLPRLIIRALRYTLHELYTADPGRFPPLTSAGYDPRVYLEVIQSISEADVQGWVRDLVAEGQVRRGTPIETRSHNIEKSYEEHETLGKMAQGRSPEAAGTAGSQMVATSVVIAGHTMIGAKEPSTPSATSSIETGAVGNPRSTRTSPLADPPAGRKKDPRGSGLYVHPIVGAAVLLATGRPQLNSFLLSMAAYVPGVGNGAKAGVHACLVSWLALVPGWALAAISVSTIIFVALYYYRPYIRALLYSFTKINALNELISRHGFESFVPVARAGGKNTRYVMENGFPAVKERIWSGVDVNAWGKALAAITRLVGGEPAGIAFEHGIPYMMHRMRSPGDLNIEILTEGLVRARDELPRGKERGERNQNGEWKPHPLGPEERSAADLPSQEYLSYFDAAIAALRNAVLSKSRPPAAPDGVMIDHKGLTLAAVPTALAGIADALVRTDINMVLAIPLTGVVALVLLTFVWAINGNRHARANPVWRKLNRITGVARALRLMARRNPPDLFIDAGARIYSDAIESIRTGVLSSDEIIELYDDLLPGPIQAVSINHLVRKVIYWRDRPSKKQLFNLAFKGSRYLFIRYWRHFALHSADQPFFFFWRHIMSPVDQPFKLANAQILDAIEAPADAALRQTLSAFFDRIREIAGLPANTGGGAAGGLNAPQNPSEREPHRHPKFPPPPLLRAA